jgi:hypothetical protein
MADEKRMAENFMQALDQMQTVYNPRIQIPGKLMAPRDSAARDSTKK